MGLIKFLPWLILIAIALMYIPRMMAQKEKVRMKEELESMRRKLNEREQGRPQESAGEMVKCPCCGIFFPKNEGAVKNGRLYCSRDCARRG